MENPVAEQRLRTMCINWCFLHDPSFLTKLGLSDYKKIRFDLYNKLISHPQFETIVRPSYEEFKSQMVMMPNLTNAKFLCLN